MSVLVRGYLLLHTAWVLVLGAVLFVGLLLKSLWLVSLLVAVAWVAVAVVFRWLLRYKTQPNEWLWQRGDSPRQVRHRLHERWPALVAVAFLGAVLIVTQLVDLSRQVVALVDGGAILVALMITWIVERSRREGEDAE